MLENCKTAKERWGGVSAIIDRWLQERQDLLVRFCDLSSKDNQEQTSYGDSLRTFCQILVDYVSAGHFEVYDQLIREGKEFNDKPALRTAQTLYKKIDPTTDLALDFNDKYLETDDLDAIGRDLSQLGEALETRFAAEDEMISVLHTAHKNQVA
ncbi:sigma D regulator [Biformimicrobium ophioploci]|uniref:Rsd/AlgQ family anti-sigma factor n=1 Tax=Biformimicrobium ophioploci TaxID=3036711 RepID=A0ABQ6LVV3_9GAMM|nr:sigma D regulator [Microbulbifer sp. NKW57]GMG86195.1 Rsd/AlgQ family anti-sigma factor [Microbulbifer sp. NKW57]